ncbi:Protein PAF1-like protein [Zea mays]|uniref:Protein PAF1-like protein n=1 Tax=Zea mays TaxID=4577 RepID=A0A1D6PVZ7_MAIZE|nr:Protein PAF1-like protein [Zea mays]
MASYRPYAPPPQHPPPPPPPPQGGYPPQMNSYAPPPQQAPYSRMPAPTYHAGPPPPPPPGPPPPHQPQFNFGPGPPQQLPPPPPPQMYYQPPPPPYGGNSNPPPPPSAPPPPPSPPPAASPPPPPPPAQPPSAHALLPPKGPQPKATLLRAETEEERRARKKREFEKQRVDDRKQHQMMRQTQATILQKTQQVRTAQQQPQSRHHHHHPPGGSRAGATGSRPATAVNAERFENRLKKPTTFLCKHKFRNELPDPSAQLKWLPLNKDKDRYTKYRITSLEKNYIPKMIVPEDIGIPLDLLDMSVYNPPDVQPPMAPEDEELLRDDQVLTPIKQEGTRKRERPTDKGVSWLVKTQYISPLSADAAKTSLTEKQAKERRESRGGRNAFLDNLNDREKQIKAIEESFRAAKSRPVHQTKRGMQAEWVMPLLPDFDRYEEPFVMVNFDGDPTADSEQYNKLERPVRDECESRAVMKSFSVSGSDPSKQEKFLAYMAPAPHELTRDLDDENDDIQYSWLREYHWEVRGDDKDDPTTYLVTFDKKDGAKYLVISDVHSVL